MSKYIVVDNETNGLLYSMVLMAEIRRKKQGQWAKIYRIPAEAWIAFLQVRYAKVLEVQAYLQAVDRGKGINPDKGAMLEAIDQRCEIPEEQLRHGLELYGEEGRQWLADADNQSADDEGEEWKKG